MEKVKSKDGTLIAYRKSGSGPPLLLVHGTGGTSERWSPVVPFLEASFKVYAMDRRGRGESGDAKEHYAIEREFEDVAAVVESIGGKVSLLGHSYGGICALESVLLTANVGRLALYEPPVKNGPTRALDKSIVEKLRTSLASGDDAGALVFFMRDVVRMPEEEIRLSTSLAAWPGRVRTAHTLPRELMAAEQYQFEAARFTSMLLPTLLLLGGESPAHVKATTDLLSKALPKATVALLPGQQHAAMETAPEMLAEAVKRFMLSS